MNQWGKQIRLSIFGESHGPAVGITIDGITPGIPLDIEDFMIDILRRKGGIATSGKKGCTSREEGDIPEFLSGIYNGCTTGAPLTIIFRNEDVRSEDYEKFRDIPRPGHADFTASMKYNFFNDLRGGGHFSGRLTLPLVAAGVVAKKMIESSVKIEAKLLNYDEAKIKEAMATGDSLGGLIECHADGVPAGLGEPFFDSMESKISSLIFAIPGVRGIEFGDGFAVADMLGSEHNDPFVSIDGRTSKNGSGGINGGISNGNQLLFRIAVKPTSSITKSQTTLNFITEEVEELSVPGRHDACFALRLPVIVEAVTAIVLADLI